MTTDPLPQGAVSIGALSLWADPVTGDVSVGNAAAAREALSQSTPARPPTPLPDLPAPNGPFAYDRVLAAGPSGPAVRLRCAAPEMAPYFTALFCAAETERPAQTQLDLSLDPDGMVTLWREGRVMAHGLNALRAPDTSTPRVNPVFEVLLTLLPGTKAVLHGAALIWEGRTLCLIGQSGAGKSTLAALLTQAGARYLGDDFIALATAEDGTPCTARIPFSPSVKSGILDLLTPLFPCLKDAPLFHKDDTDFKLIPDAAFSASDRAPAPSLFLFPHYVPDAVPRAVRLSPEECLFHIASSGAWVAEDGLPSLARALSHAPAVALRHAGDLAQIAPQISNWLRGTDLPQDDLT